MGPEYDLERNLNDASPILACLNRTCLNPFNLFAVSHRRLVCLLLANPKVITKKLKMVPRNGGTTNPRNRGAC
jgi:hypothetical protein